MLIMLFKAITYQTVPQHNTAQSNQLIHQRSTAV